MGRNVQLQKGNKQGVIGDGLDLSVFERIVPAQRFDAGFGEGAKYNLRCF